MDPEYFPEEYHLELRPTRKLSINAYALFPITKKILDPCYKFITDIV